MTRIKTEDVGYWGPDVDGDWVVNLLGVGFAFAVADEEKAQEIVGRIREFAATPIERLREENARLKARYTWLANATLACDYGDNEMGGLDSPDRIGWCVRFTRRNAEPFIFGQSIDAAIDAALTPSVDET